MAIYHHSVKVMSRSHGRCAIAAAAYRSCSNLGLTVVDKETGISVEQNFDYSNKHGLVFSQIMAAENAPEWVFDRQKLWQRVENIEGRIDSQLAREFVIALPEELTVEQNIALLKEFVEVSLVSRGMIADVNFHNDNPDNPHAHIMCTTRSLEVMEDGTIDLGGKRRDWNNVAMLRAIRQEQAIVINRNLELYGHESRVTHLSHAAFGLDLIPTVHEGPGRWIKNAELRQLNQDIVHENASRIVADPTIVIDKLSFDKPVFTSLDIEKELHKALIEGINPDLIRAETALKVWSKNELLTMYNTVISSNKITLVNPGDLKGRVLFARTDRVELEQRFEENVRSLADKRDHRLDVKIDDIAEISEGVDFSQSQKHAIIDVLGGSNISVLEGWPGAGKTTVMKEIIRQYKLAGYNVIGTAPTNKASKELKDQIGIEVENTTKLRQLWQELKTGKTSGLNLKADYYKEGHYKSDLQILDSKTVLIIDEASMVDLPSLDYFVNELKQAGGKVIKLGDNNQNPAIGYKGGFSKSGDIAGRTVLMEINRHQNEDEYVRAQHIEATQAIGRYDIAKAISIYENLGMFKIFDTELQKQEAIVNEYTSYVINTAKDQGDQFALRSAAIAAYTNGEVDNINAMVRIHLKNAGVIKAEGKPFHSGGRDNGIMVELCHGDQIIFKRNKDEFEGYGGVRNNEIGIITKLGEVNAGGSGEFEVKVREGDKGYRIVKIKTGEEKSPISFKHGYALTGHAVQGASVDKFFYSIDKHTGYEAFNVGASRHKIDCSIYASKEILENEVYKTKDLDVAKVRNELKAYAYKYVKGLNKEGKIQWNKVDVPVWKVGLRLLISKRTDLNFASDYSYSYSSNSHKKIIAHSGNIEINRGKLNALHVSLNQWKESKETLSVESVEDPLQVASDSKEAMEHARNYMLENPIESELKKYFIIKQDEIYINPIGITKAIEEYKQVAINEGSISSPNKMNEHVSTLKLGVGTGAVREKLKWSDLNELDRNLIIRSILDEEEIIKLDKTVKKVDKLEKLIKLQSNKLGILYNEYSVEGGEGNRLLSGNHGAVRDYLNAKEQARGAQEAVTVLDKYLKKLEIQQQLMKESKEYFGIELDKVEINSNAIAKADSKFSANHSNLDSNEVSDINVQKVEYLTEQLESGKALSKGDKHLLLAVILENSESPTLKGKYSDIAEKVEKLNIAKIEQEKRSRIIVDHYHGFVKDDLKLNDISTVSMSKLIAQVNINYETIRKHAGLEQVKHYFDGIGNNGTIITNAHFTRIVDVIELANSKDRIIGDEEVRRVTDAHGELMVILNNHRELLAVKELVKVEATLEHTNTISELSKIEKFKSEELPHYLSTIYKDKPQQVLARFEKMIADTEYPIALASSMSNSPEMLGRLKNTGLLAGLLKGDEVRDIKANLENLSTNLIRYVKSEDMGAILKTKLGGNKLVNKIKELEHEIVALKSQLPTKEEQHLLDDIGELKDRGNLGLKTAGIELTNLFQSENARNIFHDSIAFKNSSITKEDEHKESSIAIENLLVTNTGSSKRSRKVDTKDINPDLNFKTVKSLLTAGNLENIFRDHALKLNPDVKIIKKGNSITCGSLNMNLTNGLWHRFSDGSKGDVFSLIEQATGLPKKDALLTIASIVGINKHVDNIKTRIPVNKVEASREAPKEIQSRSNWIAYDVIPDRVPALNVDKDLHWLLKTGDIEKIWEYKNAAGKIIGNTIRIIDKETGKKQVLPVAYCHNEKLGQDQWRLKGFSDNGYKPIYGMERLFLDLKPVLIVEGEKTADKAQELLLEYTVISWMGGAQGTSNVNWKYLAGRDVTIWADNDLAGSIAAKSILHEINKANGFSGFCSIVDTQSLNLPEKWGLADELPSHMALKDINKAILDSRALNLNIAMNLNAEEERIIAWQGNVIGINKNKESIKYEADLIKQVAHLLNKQELIEYMDYGIAKGRAEYEHNFLSLKDPLYREILAASVVRFVKDNEGKENAHEIKKIFNLDHQALDSNMRVLPEVIINTAQDLYKKYNNSLNTSFLHDSHKENNELREYSPAKAELYAQLIKDFSLLHIQQLGVKSLSKTHQDMLSHDIAAIVKGYNLSYKGNQRTFENYDRTAIAKTLHEHINSPNWWQSLARKELENKDLFEEKNKAHLTYDGISQKLREFDKNNQLVDKLDYLISLNSDNTVISYIKHLPALNVQIQDAIKGKEILDAKFNEDLNFTLRLYKDKLDEIKYFNPRFDIEDLKQKLLGRPETQRDKHIEETWINIFQEHIKPKLDHFDELKKEANTVDQYIKAFKKQKDYCSGLYDPHQKLIDEARMSFKDKRIESIMMTEKKIPGFLDVVERDVNHGISIGLWTEKEALDRLKGADHLSYLVNSIKKDCENHHTDTITKDLEHIDIFKSLTRDNIQFTDHKTYLEHHHNNYKMFPNIYNNITQKLTVIYKHEELEQQREEAKKSELQRNNDMIRELGKGGLTM